MSKIKKFLLLVVFIILGATILLFVFGRDKGGNWYTINNLNNRSVEKYSCGNCVKLGNGDDIDCSKIIKGQNVPKPDFLYFSSYPHTYNQCRKAVK